MCILETGISNKIGALILQRKLNPLCIWQHFDSFFIESYLMFSVSVMFCFNRINMLLIFNGIYFFLIAVTFSATYRTSFPIISVNQRLKKMGLQLYSNSFHYCRKTSFSWQLRPKWNKLQDIMIKEIEVYGIKKILKKVYLI